MAVKTSVTVRCDGDGCNAFIDVEKETSLAGGWYRTVQAEEITGKPGRPFDFCSLRCVERWAKARAIALGERKERGGNRERTEQCPYCPEMFSPQGLRLHVASTHQEEAALDAATAP